MKRLAVCALLLLAGAAGCASVRPDNDRCADFGPGGRLCLLPPADLPTVSLTHLVRLSKPDAQEIFIGRVRANGKHLRIAATSLFGPDLFTVGYDGERIARQGGDPRLRPVYLLAVMEFIFAPAERLRPALHGLRLSASNPSGRCLENHQTKVLCVHSDGKPLRDARLEIVMPPSKITMTLTPMQPSTRNGATR
ncbi:MAG: DUF3261 domain-containing protein [Gammaproteobacteria bacterium]|jgi:hypothetical protein